jgi:UDP-N-acetylglucosamine diphosphorylase/glucosamine-1-phosphate N-acetyltransferase
MNIILFDDNGRSDLLPLCFTRPCAELRVGILTLTEKWKHRLTGHFSFLTQDYLTTKYPVVFSHDNFYLNGRCLPNEETLSLLNKLALNQAIYDGEILIAYRGSEHLTKFDFLEEVTKSVQIIDVQCDLINYTYDVFLKNGQEIKADYDLLTSGRISQPISESNTLIGHDIFVEEGAILEASVLNSTHGPIYIAAHSEIMEGSLIRGPFALCEHSTIKMGAKIYGDTTVGPHSKVGGEVSNTVFYGFSNKGHDGFLGNSVIGEWCNLGADTNSSNLKNNYAQVKLWNYTKNRFVNTGLQFCGLIMGDHSKCGINTMFNTGTVVGVSANIFGAGFPRNYIPSFTWGGATGFATYEVPKAFETASIVLQRRGLDFDPVDQDILTTIFKDSAKDRFWESKSINT